ncbi:uncharacterized protein Dwil_GK25154 [Drosophila willistoni]|uniref:PPIase cyclophilin-type domain-containing protein n=1 Tax=Drosophila willistoni TaxID=7260 RepID=B4NC29_DROWI|nr:uncharacterized protein LOC6648348 [Drosophila willistoni]EDW82388.1 uncharacterized protein Dwil_GK25154 [Drosophila willistoni]
MNHYTRRRHKGISNRLSDCVRRAHSLIDNKPPVFPAAHLGNVDALLNDARTYLQRTKENVRILLHLSRIMRTMGTIGTQSQTYRIGSSMVPTMVRHVEKLERQNIELGKRLMGIKYLGDPRPAAQTPRSVRSGSIYNTQSRYSHYQSISESFIAPNTDNQIFAKYNGFNLQLPKDNGELVRLLRPRITLHFGAIDGRPLGDVIIQLYTEAAPLIVLQFMRTCLEHRSHEFSVRRIFPHLWLECYLVVSNSARPSLSAQPSMGCAMEFDTRVVDHGRYAYVLSCSKEYCSEGFPSNGSAINFTISFKPLRVSNGRRVGFGRVIRGDKIIHCMQAHGTKNGKISKPVIITHCDVL